MLRGFAPSALRMPNSWVRSRTVMSMMFEMPTTPLSSVSRPTTQRAVRRMPMASALSLAPVVEL